MIREVVNRKWVDNKRDFTYLHSPIEDSLIVKKRKGGYEVKYLVQDTYADNSDLNMDEELFIVNYHRDFFIRRDEIIKEDDVRSWYQGERIEQEKAYHIFKLSCYIYSGVALSLGYNFAYDAQEWNTSHVGVVLVSKKSWKTRKKALKVAESLIEHWNMHLRGDVYCLVREKYDDKKKRVSHDIVGGYYGYEEALKELAGDW